MKPDRFFTKLGWMSSHPLYQRRRWRWSQAIALVPLATVVILGLWIALDADKWLGMIQHARLWFHLVGGGLALALGGLLTLSLTARLAELQGRQKLGLEKTRREYLVERSVGLAAVILGVLGPLLALALRGAARWNGVRFACHLFSVFPLVGLLVGMWYLEGALDDRKATRKRRPIWCLLGSLVLALLAFTLLHDLAVTAERSGLVRFFSHFVPAWYRELGQPFLGALLLAPLCFALLAIWRLFPASVPVARVVPGAPPDPRRKGVLATLWDWLKRLFLPTPDRVPPEEDRWPTWLDEMLSHLPDGCRRAEGPARLESAEGSAISGAVELKPLFGGVTPTTDQFKLFQRFRESYDEVVRETFSAGTRREREPSANLVVEGDAGSGRTTALVACAIYAALARGQHVLFLVPNSLRQRIIKQRIDATLTALQLDHYVSTGIITAPAVAGWLMSREDRPAPVPQILIGTLDAVEIDLYGQQHLQDEQLSRLRRLIVLLEVVIVDDYLDFDDAERSHLPFMLDKQRLLLEAELAPLQVVVACPQLAAIARMTLGTRLYTERLLQLDRNVIRLRPRQGGPAWRVDLEADDPRKAVDAMVVWCLRHGLDVVLYRRGIDEGECLRQESDLCEKAGGDPHLTVLADLDQPLKASPGDVEAVFYQVAAHQDICLALRLHLGGADCVIFSIGPADEARDAPVAGIVPVVADRSAVPLMIAHLRSLARFLPCDSPIAEAAWLQFGLSFDQLRSVQPAGAPELSFRRDAWQGGDPGYRAQLWPYVTLHSRQRLLADPVDSYSLPDETQGIFQEGCESVYFVGRLNLDTRALHGRRATWFSSAGQPLHRSADLAHAREFRLADGTEVFVPQPRIQAFGEEYRFTTQHWRGDGEDAYLPVYTIDWELNDCRAVPLGGGPDHGLQWFSLETKDDRPVDVNATVQKLMTEYGAETPIESVQFGFPARLSGLLLCPDPIRSDGIGRTIGDALAGQWGTAGSFTWSTVLTGAITYALHVRLPGLSYFANCLAFWLDSEDPPICRAIVWFLEPTDGGRTVMPILGGLLSDPEERSGFFRSVAWFLEQVDRVTRKQRFIRRFSRIGFEGDDTIDRLAEARDLACKIIRQSESPSGAGM